ncbi:hypothetical protein K5G30_002391 [Enterococcus faecalis]|nr:hypothetical protein [Enterococcus faecalis]
MEKSIHDIGKYLPNGYEGKKENLKEKYHDSVMRRKEEMLMGHRIQDCIILENVERVEIEGVNIG